MIYHQIAQELRAQLLAQKDSCKPTQKRKVATEASSAADKPGMEKASKEEDDREDEALQAPLKKVTCCVHLPCVISPFYNAALQIDPA